MRGGPAGRHRFALGIEIHGGHALRVAAASQKRPARTHALKHRLAAFRTSKIGGHGRFPALVAFARLGVRAIGITAASPESAALAKAAHTRLAAPRTICTALI